jgi:thiol-disulfide isomerase/thioredoxin
MKNLLQLLFIGLTVLSFNTAFGQIADGKIAPDWDVTDLDGNDWTLEEFMDDGKHVILDFSATWCGPCWSYHQTGILEALHDNLGPNGDDILHVFMFEADGDTNDACCYGPSGCNDGSWGNWTNVPYPVVNLTGSELNTVGQYQIAYFPTIFIINGDHQTVWEVGQATYGSWSNIINQSFSLEVDVEVDPGTCGLGELSVSSTGGAGSVFYEWSTGQFGESIEVESGTYEVSATDANGYFVVVEVEIENEQEVFTLSDEYIENVSCAGEEDGEISIEFENTGDLSFEWSNGDDDENIDDLEPGTYYLTVTNEDNGCTGEFEFEIEEPEAMEADFNVIGTSCGLNNGEVEIFVEGGAGNYLYDFGDGSIIENMATGIEGGILVVVVEDDNGCELELEVMIPESEALAGSLVGENTITCLSPEVTFTIETNTINDINYTWIDPAGVVVSTESHVSVSNAGEYTVDLIDAVTGCSYQETFLIVEDLQLPSITLSAVEELNCQINSFDVSFTNDSIDPVIAEWSYVNQDGDLITVNSDVLTIIEPGDYSLLVQNIGNGCEVSHEFSVGFYDNTPSALFTATLDVETATITATATGDNITESWLLNGVEIDIQDGIIIFEENGSYELCYLVENECGVAEHCEIIEVEGIISSTSDFTIEGVSVYASFGNIIIENTVGISELVQITVSNASGQRVYSETLKLSGSHSIELQNWTSGVYFVSLKIEAGTYCTKVFKL